MAILNNFQDIILVSVGAIFGANVRFIIYQKLKEINIKRYNIILIINAFSSFLLGLFIPILSKIKSPDFSSQLGFFFIIGFLGSLSTFSAFIYDLYDSFLKYNFFRAVKLFTLSFFLGIIALTLGSLLAN